MVNPLQLTRAYRRYLNAHAASKSTNAAKAAKAAKAPSLGTKLGQEEWYKRMTAARVLRELNINPAVGGSTTRDFGVGALLPLLQLSGPPRSLMDHRRI